MRLHASARCLVSDRCTPTSGDTATPSGISSTSPFSLSPGPSRGAPSLVALTDPSGTAPAGAPSAVDSLQAPALPILQDPLTDVQSTPLHAQIVDLHGGGDPPTNAPSPFSCPDPSAPAISPLSRSHSLAPPSDSDLQYYNDAPSSDRASTATLLLRDVATEAWTVRFRIV